MILVQAPVGLGNAGLPAHLPAAGARAQARAAVDPVLRLGPRADEPDRHRPLARRAPRCAASRAAARERLAQGFWVVVFPGGHARRAGRAARLPARRRLAGRGEPARRWCRSRTTPACSGRATPSSSAPARSPCASARRSTPRTATRRPSTRSPETWIEEQQKALCLIRARRARRSNTASRAAAGARSASRSTPTASVAAPLRAPWRDIEGFLREKERWILAKLDEWAARAAAACAARRERRVAAALRRRASTLEVRAGRRACSASGAHACCRHRARATRPRCCGWLKAQALEALAPRAAHYAARLGAARAARRALQRAHAVGRVHRGRRDPPVAGAWCTSSPALADYVVAHEVAHLVELNHSQALLEPAGDGCILTGARRASALELAGAALPIIRGTP